MLIVVSTSYIISYLPVLIHFVMWKFVRSGLLIIDRRPMIIMQNYTRPMYIFGFAINFFLYTMSGQVFRKQLIVILLDMFKFMRIVCREKKEALRMNPPIIHMPLIETKEISNCDSCSHGCTSPMVTKVWQWPKERSLYSPQKLTNMTMPIWQYFPCIKHLPLLRDHIYKSVCLLIQVCLIINYYNVM